VGREDCVLAYYMPPFPEVIVTNGEPPMKPDYPEKMEFLVVRDHAPESVFPAVIVPSKGGDIVKEVSIGRDGDTVKYAVNAPDGLWKITVGINTGEVTAEHFGSSPLPRASLSASGSPPAEASYGDKADYTFRANTPGDAKQECQFTIKEADYLTDTVQVNETITDPKRLLGQVAIISGHGHSAAAASAAYTVAEAGEHFLRFSGPAITGMCIMEKNEGNTVSSKTRLSGYGTQLTARSLNGMVLVSEDYKDAAAIVSYELKEGIQFHMDKPLATPDANNDDRCVAWFADFGPGYVIRISLVQ